MRVKLFLSVLALTVTAPAVAQDDILDRIVNLPPPTSYRVDGGIKGSVRNDPAVQGGKALRIAVPGKGKNTWDVAVANPIKKPVKAGDELIMAFWARLEKGENGATTANLPYNAIQLSQAPYSALFTGQATIGPEWKMYEVKGKVDKDYPADSLNAAIHLATGKQTIDLGPIFVLNMGQ